MSAAVNNQVGEQVVVAVNPDGTLIGAGGTTGTGTVITSPFQAASVSQGGSATSPTAGTSVATLSAPPAGTYLVNLWVSASGTTTAAADASNMNLKQGATVKASNLPYNCGTTGSVTANSHYTFQLTLDGATNLSVNAVGNATTGAVYTALIVATRVF